MSNSRAIREWMKVNPGPRKPMEVRLALGLTRAQCNVAMSDMAKAGILAFEGPPGDRSYTLARDLPPPLTEEQRVSHLAASRRKCREKRLANGRDEAYRRSKGTRPRAVYLAELAAKAEAAKLAKPAKVAKPPKPSAEFRKRLNQQIQAKVQPSKAFVPFKPTAPLVEAETVEAWMARTGKSPEVLQPGVWSNPIQVRL